MEVYLLIQDPKTKQTIYGMTGQMMTGSSLKNFSPNFGYTVNHIIRMLDSRQKRDLHFVNEMSNLKLSFHGNN